MLFRFTYDGWHLSYTDHSTGSSMIFPSSGVAALQEIVEHVGLKSCQSTYGQLPSF